MIEIYCTPTLVDETKRGNKKFWRGIVYTDGYNVFTGTEFWQETKEGLSKSQYSANTQILGKNLGKKNETTPKQQAISEIQSQEKKQRDKGYHGLNETKSTRLLPMLAQSFEKRKDKIVYPASVQPKFDGFRALYDGKEFWTRQGKLYIPDVVKHLHFDNNGFIVDGEIDLPVEYSFQDKCKAIKKLSENSKNLIYRVYDVISDKYFNERDWYCFDIVNKSRNSHLIKCPTYQVHEEETIYKYHTHFVQEGYEGTMVRTWDEGYRPNTRSNQLLKHKDFQDAEFEVVDMTTGTGKFENVPIMVCITEEGKIFNVVPKGSDAERLEILSEKQIGSRWTVRYQGLSETGVPRFPVGIARRDFG